MAGGLGLDLLEAYTLNEQCGLVLVESVQPQSNADKTGLFSPGDSLITISSDDKSLTSLEGLNFDQTVRILRKYAGEENVTIKVRRLQPRKTITVKVVGPKGEEAASIQVIAGYDSNLRTMLIANNLRLYDDRTTRFDSPYQTGSCGGDGTCGTCVVAVLSGKDLLNDRMRVEDGALRKQLAPPNYRWSCRARVGGDPDVGGEIKIKLRPQTANW